MTELVPITSANWRRAAVVRVADVQLRFVADYEPVALVILAKAFVRAADSDWWSYVIEQDGETVGVLALVDERQRSGQIALFHLVIDAGQQRRGYGRAAIRAAITLAQQLEHCHHLRLTVHAENRVAVALYNSEGFSFDSVQPDGELSFSIATASCS